jgi:hypothetical protein
VFLESENNIIALRKDSGPFVIFFSSQHCNHDHLINSIFAHLIGFCQNMIKQNKNTPKLPSIAKTRFYSFSYIHKLAPSIAPTPHLFLDRSGVDQC